MSSSVSIQKKTTNVNSEWESFFTNCCDDFLEEVLDDIPLSDKSNSSTYIDANVIDQPEPTPLYVSTTSKMAQLNVPIDLKIFWDIPILPYSVAENGVIKKQIKINSKTPDELNNIKEKLNHVLYYEEKIITHVNNLGVGEQYTGENITAKEIIVDETQIPKKKKYRKKQIAPRIKFNDIRKITVGMCKKNITSYRRKDKQAFYNCFVLILRLKIDDTFKECHVKVFNTGKIKIPGIQNESMFHLILKNVIDILQPFISVPLLYNDEFNVVLTNSNFNCGFYILRDELNEILKNKYNIQTIYDPCSSYPGILCKFYYNTNQNIQTGIQPSENTTDIIPVSFMIFRTGNVLIVGKCNEYILNKIYEFITTMFKQEFQHIFHQFNNQKSKSVKSNIQKQRKRYILITSSLDTKIINNSNIPDNLLEDTNYQEIVINMKDIKKNKKHKSKTQLA